MPVKKRSRYLSFTLMLLVIAAGQAINVTALSNGTSTDIITTIVTKKSINITDFSVAVDGSVVDFFLP